MMEEEKKKPGRGGARPGCGRKRISDTKITFRCPQDIRDALSQCGNMSNTIVYALRKFFGMESPSNHEDNEER